MRGARTRYALLGILAIGLAVRTGYIAVSRADPIPSASDAPSYLSLAENLVAGRGFVDSSVNLSPYFPGTARTSFWSPLFPVILAGAVALGEGGRFIAVKLLNSCFSVATAWMLYLLACRLFDCRAGLIAAAAFAFYPAAIYHSNELGTESLFALLVVVWVYFCHLFAEEPSPMRAAGLGASLGLGFHTNAVMLAFVAALVAFLVLRRFDFLLHARALALAVSVFALVVAPWVVRNYRVHGAFVLVPTKSGFNLLVGNNPWADGSYIGWYPELGAAYDTYFRDRNELENARLARSLALEWVRDHPDAFAALVPVKLYRLWTPVPNIVRTPLLILAQLGSYGLVLALAVASLGYLRRRLRELSLCYLLCGVVSGVAAIYFGAARFRFPIEGVLVALAAGVLSLHAAAARRPEGARLNDHAAQAEVPR